MHSPAAIERARIQFESCEDLSDMEFGAEMRGDVLVVVVHKDCADGRKMAARAFFSPTYWKGEGFDIVPAARRCAISVRTELEREEEKLDA